MKQAFYLLLAISVISCSKIDHLKEIIHNKTENEMLCKDIDGNIYKTVKIGDKVWMAENLKVTRFRNGAPIHQVPFDYDWQRLRIYIERHGWCHYDNDSSNNETYGKLYNWYAVNDPRGLAPKGWHVATREEWIELGIALGGPEIAGGKIKTPGTIEQGNGLWFSPNVGASNSSGFNAVPGGRRFTDGQFAGKGETMYWWTSNASTSDDQATYAHTVSAVNYTDSLFNGGYGSFIAWAATSGHAVRCVRD